MTELSVVIPTYNRAEQLQACLEALAHQTQSFDDFEVIVVIDGARDGTAELLSGLNTPYILKIVEQENQGQNVARNHGVEFAQGHYCLFLDDDIIADSELVAEHLRLHREQARVVGIGQMALVPAKNSSWYLNTYAKGWQGHYDELNEGIRKPAWTDCYGGNFSVSRSIFLEVGGFASDIRRSHDVELGYRLQHHGVTFAYLAKAIGIQDERKGIGELMTDLEKAGSAWVTLCQRHPDMYPHLLGPLFQSLRESLLREIFWRFRISPIFLAHVGGFFGSTAWSRKWFRFINQYTHWRGVRRATNGRGRSKSLMQGVPVLMYHAFGKPGETASRFVLPLQRFTQQMTWLKRLGYCVLTMDEFHQYQSAQNLPPQRSVVISIDDGYAELHQFVYPILKHYGFPATVFIVTNKVGTRNDWASSNDLRGRKLLSWEEIYEMSQNGIRFGAHSRTHTSLATVSLEQMREEIAGSKLDLENALQMPITTFAYPYGEYDSTLQSITRDVGFQSGFSANSGLNVVASPMFALHRIEIDGTISLPRFLLALWLGSAS